MMAAPSGIPSSLQPLLSRAELLASRKDWDGAIAAYEKLLAHVPNEPYTLVQLSYMYSLRGDYRRAADFALSAERTGTTDPKILAELLPRLRTFNQVQQMVACIERAMPMDTMPIPLLIAAAAQLSYVNLPERAIDFLDEAQRADPDYPSTLLARTQVLTYLGRFADAEQDVTRALRRAPEIAQGYWLQAGLRRQTADSNHVGAIKRELERGGRAAEDVALLSFALHKELDDLEQYEEAWLALVRGCRAKRSRLNYDSRQTQQLFDALTEFEAAAPQHASAADRFCRDSHLHRGSASLRHHVAGADAGRASRGAGARRAVRFHQRHALRHRSSLQGSDRCDDRATGPQHRSRRRGQALSGRHRLASGGSALLHRQATVQLPQHRLHCARPAAGQDPAHGPRSGGDLLLQSAGAVFGSQCSQLRPRRAGRLLSTLQCADEALARAVSRTDSGRGIREARRGTGSAVAPCDRVLRLVLRTRHAQS